MYEVHDAKALGSAATQLGQGWVPCGCEVRTPHDALHEAHADLVLVLGDQAVVVANLAHELKAAPVKAGHDWVALQQHRPLNHSPITMPGKRLAHPWRVLQQVF